MNAPIAAKPTPWRPTTTPGSQIRPMMRQKEGRSPAFGATPGTGSAIMSPISGTSAETPITPVNPNWSKSARPTGPPTAKAPYMPMPTSAITRPEASGPMMPKPQARSPTSVRLSPRPSSSRPAIRIP